MSKRAFSYRAGALTIGSLLWDSRNREVWRESSFGPTLSIIRVPVPIRYGRYSTRKHRLCPTMIYSHKHYQENQWGQGAVFPFRNQLMPVSEMITEARNMSGAEGDKQKRFILT